MHPFIHSSTHPSSTHLSLSTWVLLRKPDPYPHRAPGLLSKDQQRLDEPCKVHLSALLIHPQGPSLCSGLLAYTLAEGTESPLHTHIPSVSCSPGLPIGRDHLLLSLKPQHPAPYRAHIKYSQVLIGGREEKKRRN